MDISQYTNVPYEYIYENLSEEEGEKLVAYTDTRGYTTVGIGHCCSSNPIKLIIGREIKVGQSITPEESKKIFDHDLVNVLSDLQKLDFFKSLSEHEQYVLIDLTFNLGYAGLLKFKHFLEAMREHDNKSAIAELKNSAWFHQVGRRAQYLINLLEV